MCREAVLCGYGMLSFSMIKMKWERFIAKYVFTRAMLRVFQDKIYCYFISFNFSVKEDVDLV